MLNEVLALSPVRLGVPPPEVLLGCHASPDFRFQLPDTRHSPCQLTLLVSCPYTQAQISTEPEEPVFRQRRPPLLPDRHSPRPKAHE